MRVQDQLGRPDPGHGRVLVSPLAFPQDVILGQISTRPSSVFVPDIANIFAQS